MTRTTRSSLVLRPLKQRQLFQRRLNFLFGFSKMGESLGYRRRGILLALTLAVMGRRGLHEDMRQGPSGFKSTLRRADILLAVCVFRRIDFDLRQRFFEHFHSLIGDEEEISG